MITKKDLEDQRELMQDDLCCILDGLEDEVLDDVCQVIIDRMAMLIPKVDDNEKS